MNKADRSFTYIRDRSHDDILASGRRVIETETAGLQSLMSVIDGDFVEAVKLIAGVAGRVIVTGVGKSGHIGRKFAATLSATATPSYFVHAGEAGHGDLGTISADDVIVLLTNSGRTSELRAVLQYAKSKAVPIIAITGRGDAPMLEEAPVQLVLPALVEACGVNIAPTTSTTMMLALTDALAIAVMERRGVGSAQLMLLHPGGVIGTRNMLIETLLSPNDFLPLVRPSSRLRDVVLDMTVAGRGMAGVVDDDGMLIGGISDGDLRRAFDHVLTACAGDVMTRDPYVLSRTMTISDASAVLQERRINAAFVVESSDARRPIGLLGLHDLNAIL